MATSNDVTALPAELTRKGRFDELFFVDFLDPVERDAIVRHHLTVRNRNPDLVDLDALATMRRPEAVLGIRGGLAALRR